MMLISSGSWITWSVEDLSKLKFYDWGIKVTDVHLFFKRSYDALKLKETVPTILTRS